MQLNSTIHNSVTFKPIVSSPLESLNATAIQNMISEYNNDLGSIQHMVSPISKEKLAKKETGMQNHESLGSVGALKARKAVEEIIAKEALIDLELENQHENIEPKKPLILPTSKSLGRQEIGQMELKHKKSSEIDAMLRNNILNDSENIPSESDNFQEGKINPKKINPNEPLEVDPDLCSIQSDYQMVSDLFNFSELQNQPNFGIKRYKKAVYRGQISDNHHREGLGVQVNENGRIYEGEWIADKRNGNGFEIYKSGNQYRGKFVNNHPQGKGAFFWTNGEVYDGEWL